MSQETENQGITAPLARFKCAKCHHPLRNKNSVQLTACLHILCSPCIAILENEYLSNIRCPQCHTENARPSVLTRISGVRDSLSWDLPCDNSQSHDRATWNCFDCGQNLCIPCRASHAKDHKIMQLLAHPVNLDLDHGDGNFPSLPSELGEEIDSSDGVGAYGQQQCPVCGSADCDHMAQLRILTTEPQSDIGCCKIQGHVDCNERPLELNYFCLKCWMAVCGDCAQKGEHKLHETRDLITVGDFLEKSIAKQKERLNILLKTCGQDVEEEDLIEKRLSQHVKDVANEMTDRKRIILEETTRAFENAVQAAKVKGQEILGKYRNTLQGIESYQTLIQRVFDAVNSIQVDRGNLNVARYVSAFNRQDHAAKLIGKMEEELQSLQRPVELRLVLPDVKTLSIDPPPLARVTAELKHLELDFTLKLEGDYTSVFSIVVMGREECLVSCRRPRSQTDDMIVLFKKDAAPVEFDVPEGRYFISRLESGEIVASYTSETSNAVMYCDGREFEKRDNRRRVCFREITPFSFPPYGIATTKDNNILLCCNADEKKGISYLMLLTLQGRVIEETCRTGQNMISPNYVAVSDTGEICACDTEGSSVFILNEKLDIKERMNYRLPTSMTDAMLLEEGDAYYQRVFQPQGVCYDSYGRIIVADANNNCVVRLVRDTHTHEYKMEPLLTKTSEMEHFRYPQLVALKDGRLWVVCQEHIFVFKYCN